MFYVAYLIGFRRYIVIPTSWVYESDKILEKFVNNRLNSNQKILCFWSSVDGALNEEFVPNWDFIPNFSAPRATTYPCEQGCYIVFIRKFFCHYNDARDYLHRLRPYEPALYYENRLLEEPVPAFPSPTFAEVLVEENHENFLLVEPVLPLQQALVASAHMHNGVGIFNNNNTEENLLSINPLSDIEIKEELPTFKISGEDMRACLAVLEEDPMNDNGGVNGGRKDIKANIGNIRQENANGQAVLVNQNDLNGSIIVHDHAYAKADVETGITNNAESRGQNNDNRKRGTRQNENSAGDGGNVDPSNEDNDVIVNGNDDITNNAQSCGQSSDNGKPGTRQNESCDGDAVNVGHSNDDNDDVDTGNDDITNNAKSRDQTDNGKPDTQQSQNCPNDPSEDNDDDEDVVITLVSGAVFPQPQKTDKQGLFKRENDVLSGNLPFDITPKGDRIYSTGTKLVNINKVVIDSFVKWMEPPHIDNEFYDKQLVRAMLISCLGEKLLASNNIGQETTRLIETFLEIRVKKDPIRMSKLEAYTTEYCSELKKKVKKPAKND